MSRRAVKYTPEFRRIEAIERRDIDPTDAEIWVRVLNPQFLAPGSKASLLPWQAYVLAELARCDGCWAALPVGTGKTLLSYLAGSMVKARRPLLILPANLIDKTRSDFASYIGVWRTPNPPPRLESWHRFTTDAGARLLYEIQPDLIVLDEADDLSNGTSSVPRRITRYIKWQRARGVRVIVLCMTGTPSRKSILAYHHQLEWCLGDRSPLPRTLSEAKVWAACLDDKGPMGQRIRRPHPGPMGETRDGALRWYAARLRQTPGVVIVDEDSCAMPLEFRVRLAREDKVLDAHYETFARGENPAGIPVGTPLSRWILDGQLGCGYFSKWDPPPPPLWREYRRSVAKLVRAEIERSQRTSEPIETEGQALRRLRGHRIVDDWLEKIKPTYDEKANTSFEWVSDSLIESARDWLREIGEPGIIWVGSPELGQRMARKLRLPYYGEKGVDQHGNGLHKARPGTSMVVSWNANKKGFNLQAWCKMLVAQPPASAKWIEQLVGRAHRKGQTRAVTIYYLAHSGGSLDGFEAMLSEAGFAKRTVGLTQKVLRAKIVRAKPKITASNKYRWARKVWD